MAYIINGKEIIASVNIVDLFLHDGDVLTNVGKDRRTDCPNCGKKGGKSSGISISPSKNIAKCFSCHYILTPGDYFKIRHKLEYNEAIAKLSEIGHVPIQYDTKQSIKPAKKSSQKSESNSPNNFCERQLAGSGLTDELCQSEVILDKDTKKIISRYTTGSKDEAGNIVNGDDMILHYVNLYRQYETYYRKKKDGTVTGQAKTFTRIRYQHPEQHLDKQGKAMKYASPIGSGCHIWHPEPIIKKFNRGAEIKHLHIQEGEKKADKATQHGINSCGIGGIHMLADNQGLNPDFSLIIQKCKTTDVYFWVDSDWQDLPEHKNIDSRARTFLSAIRNFQTYFLAFFNEGLDLKLHLCYVNKTDPKIKGIDDLLVSLPGKEDEVLKDLEFAHNAADGKGQLVSCINISGYGEGKMKEFFQLHSHDAFFEYHKAELIERKEFMFQNTAYVFNDETGEFELKHPITHSEKWWEVKRNRDNHTSYIPVFDNFQEYCFNRKIGRLTISENNERLIKANIETKTLDFISSGQLVNYCFEDLDKMGFTPVKNHFHMADQMFEEKRLLRLKLLDESVKIFSHSKNTGYMFYKNGFWQINGFGLDIKSIKDSEGFVWHNQVRDFEPKLTQKQIVKVVKTDEKTFSLEYSEEAENCHFLQFLRNTGNFKGHIHESELPETDRYLIDCHLVNKLTALGYLLHRHFDAANAKAVVAMDSEREGQSDGESFGRSGKSLLSDALKNLVACVAIDGKKPNINEDKYLFADVDERTAVIIMDDIRKGFDFESLLSKITGNFSVRKMNLVDIKISKANTPKIFLTTNHSIKGAVNNPSFEDRIFYVVFSDFYNIHHKPIEDFHARFFDDWEFDQWNYFYNLAASSLQIYLEHGLVEAPGNLHTQKQQRGEIGEDFMCWADAYFINTEEPRFDVELAKNEIYSNYVSSFKNPKFLYAARKFWSIFKMWCSYHGFSAQGLTHSDRIQRGTSPNRFDCIKLYKKGIVPGEVITEQEPENYPDIDPQEDIPF